MSRPILPRAQMAASARISPTDWDGLDPYIRPDLAHCALVTIDVQVDFLKAGAHPLPGTDDALPAISRLADAFRSSGRPIVHVVRLYEGSDVDLVRRSAIEAGAAIVRPGSPGSQLADGLRPPGAADLNADRLLAGHLQELGPDEAVIWKPRWSGFYRTGLDQHLTSMDVDTLVVAGFNYPNCPRATITDASARDYRLVLAADAISGVLGTHLDEAAAIGVVATASTTIAALLPAASAR